MSVGLGAAVRLRGGEVVLHFNDFERDANGNAEHQREKRGWPHRHPHNQLHRWRYGQLPSGGKPPGNGG